MNWKGFGRKRSWHNLKALSQHIFWRYRGKPQEISVRIAFSAPGFEIVTYQIRSWSVNHSTTMFDYVCTIVTVNLRVFVIIYEVICAGIL
jgi:hypothetical protein